MDNLSTICRFFALISGMLLTGANFLIANCNFYKLVSAFGQYDACSLPQFCKKQAPAGPEQTKQVKTLRFIFAI